jgi:hypothetical protein
MARESPDWKIPSRQLSRGRLARADRPVDIGAEGEEMNEPFMAQRNSDLAAGRSFYLFW